MIRDTGEPGRCVARQGNCKYGYGEEEHHSTKESARQAFEQSQGGALGSLQKVASKSFNKFDIAKTVNFHSAEAKANKIDRALESNLEYTGPSPRWLSKLQKDFRSVFGDSESVPKILDVIDSPVGKLAVVYSYRSMRLGDSDIQDERGFTIRDTSFVDLKTGEEVGYVKASFVDEASCQRSWGNDEWSSLRHVDEYGGSQWGTYHYIDNPEATKGPRKRGGPSPRIKVDSIQAAETPEALLEAHRQIWARSHANLYLTPISLKEKNNYIESRNLGSKDAPATVEEITKDLKVVRKEVDKTYKNFKKDFEDPFVDYSKVDNRLKGTGAGSALYIYAARMLGKENKIFRGSGIQTDAAGDVWSRFSKNEKIPVSKMTKKWSKSKPQDCFYLDFRNDA